MVRGGLIVALRGQGLHGRPAPQRARCARRRGPRNHPTPPPIVSVQGGVENSLADPGFGCREQILQARASPLRRCSGTARGTSPALGDGSAPGWRCHWLRSFLREQLKPQLRRGATLLATQHAGCDGWYPHVWASSVPAVSAGFLVTRCRRASVARPTGRGSALAGWGHEVVLEALVALVEDGVPRRVERGHLEVDDDEAQHLLQRNPAGWEV